MNEQVIVANEEFLAMLAHELRNPLSPITNAIHLIEKSAPENNHLIKEATSIVTRQVAYLSDVINNLLDLTKVIKNEMVIAKNRIEISSTIRETIRECQSILKARKQSVEVCLPNGFMWMLGDKGKIKQVLYQIIANAAKFTETGGRISVTANHGKDRIMINIRDNGIGVPSEEMNNIFNLMSQPEYTRHLAQGGGMGVGLMLAKKLIDLHSGTIEVHSDVGEGSEFTIVLPLHEVTKEPPLEIAYVKKPVDDESRLEIMVVDDHMDTAESLAILLKMWGHTVFTCHSGLAAIEKAKIVQPDVALIDIGLPGCDGYRVAETLKKDNPNIGLIAITGYGQVVDKKKSAKAGFIKHFVKPVAPNELKETLNQKLFREAECITK